MFGPRQILQSRLRYAATKCQLISRPIVRGSRHASTNTNPTTHGVTPEPSRWPRRLIYAGIFGGLGLAAGKWMDNKLAVPPFPGTGEDERKMEEIRRTFEHGLPIVKQLREDPDYREADVYGNYLEEELRQRITSGPLRGSRGLAMQKVFWNDKEKKAVNVVFLGSGTEGWPTIVHGGLLGTILDEHLARVAIQNLPERTGVTANLDINYRGLVYSGNFYTIYATLDQERSTDRKAYVTGEIRDPLGKLCVQASGLFVVPRGYKLRKIGDTY
ncbi:hypothetical protein P175DRAFT_0442156 [Aspergillus ochraceoroseus IBT 24754]|uniref:Thioesterase domain-containing protein n=3 Tax=Aspergillus subgen. Nidulantes TaxID=2720870 RepID=A0A0F8V631_9EURO|nr:uncharacterized protein P175DRAFT_0442156 [Aspergillus ochraceoroseus IBT 24754]KKK18441.1 hypothetical protein ARAM_003662 [Aspergillus rambellii]KKK23131.1 hypothetical protein AOCH_003701 [Aspergillus ochraceoroseus]PTU18911.1 hypothetical protein P175DRAFT_0442156 [Aspergillus ochraceoroseus IBT 24754]